ncbi:MAG TPA: GAF domain-containing protein [Thermoanaerobaculia bacterium]|nr:GAF domain-containing protein [Thermoanaerobaculia bacterium]
MQKSSPRESGAILDLVRHVQPEIRLDTILNSVDAAILVERHERVVFANDRYAAVLGFDSPAELLGRHVGGLVAKVDRQRLLEFSRIRAERGRAPSEYPFAACCRDGTFRVMRAEVSATTIGNDCYITTLAREISHGDTPQHAALSRLSLRERMVFDLLVTGERQKEIARILDISAKTVCTLRTRLMRKLELSDTWDLFRFATALTVGDARRLAGVRDTGLLDSEPEELFDRITALAGRMVKVPVAFVSIVGADRDYYKSAVGFSPPLRELRGETFCHHAIISKGPLIIDDTRAHPLYRTVPTVESLGVRAYLGVPLLVNGVTVGALCVIDFEPRSWSAPEIQILQDLAFILDRQIELRTLLRNNSSTRE